MKTIAFDPLYGDVRFQSYLFDLARLPVVQRLRHVRLSNIDSIALPGIANLSRYEHSIGVAALAIRTGLVGHCDSLERIALEASALLHDWAITAFGHLVEEALQYTGQSFDHQSKPHELLSGEPSDEVGGLQRQILEGRETGLTTWAQKAVGSQDQAKLLRLTTDYIQGHGRLGQLISSEIDLDNIDNVTRVAFHMGLPVDKQLPVRLAKAIVGIKRGDSRPVFDIESIADIKQWLELRTAVYEKLMLAEADFSAKVMVLQAVIWLLERGELNPYDWHLTDEQLRARMFNSSAKQITETIARWSAGELWDISALYWLAGPRPAFPKIAKFAHALELTLSRHCFAYAIKDKRNRRLSIVFNDGSCEEIGSPARQWILGVGSSARRPFTQAEQLRIIELAVDFFQCASLGPARTRSNDERELTLL